MRPSVSQRGGGDGRVDLERPDQQDRAECEHREAGGGERAGQAEQRDERAGDQRAGDDAGGAKPAAPGRRRGRGASSSSSRGSAVPLSTSATTAPLPPTSPEREREPQQRATTPSAATGSATSTSAAARVRRHCASVEAAGDRRACQAADAERADQQAVADRGPAPTRIGDEHERHRQHPVDRAADRRRRRRRASLDGAPRRASAPARRSVSSPEACGARPTGGTPARPVIARDQRRLEARNVAALTRGSRRPVRRQRARARRARGPTTIDALADRGARGVRALAGRVGVHEPRRRRRRRRAGGRCAASGGERRRGAERARPGSVERPRPRRARPSAAARTRSEAMISRRRS